MHIKLEPFCSYNPISHNNLPNQSGKKEHDSNVRNKNDEIRVQRIDEESIWIDQETTKTRDQ